MRQHGIPGSFEKCETCGEYGFVDTHKCPPAWEARFEWQDDDDWKVVYAYDEEMAAQRLSELKTDSESPIQFEVSVRPAWTDRKPTVFIIDVEYEPKYYSRHKD